MERVVYIFGAGFSAPLGLPVVSNFLEKSKDLYMQDTKKFGHFQKVFKMIRELSHCKNYYKTNLFNIEDILSLLETRSLLTGASRQRRMFERYIVDVIEAYTGSPSIASRAASWSEIVFGRFPWSLYGVFVSTMFAAWLSRQHSQELSLQRPSPYVGDQRRPGRNTTYSIITLNYDLVLERLLTRLNEVHAPPYFRFQQQVAEPPDPDGRSIQLVKLHGSVNTKEIVAPTWNKSLRSKTIGAAWKAAHRLLAEANHIRVIGYSLPESDSYIKYLLRASSIDNHHLKTFDVLCLDDASGSVRARYHDFIVFPKLRIWNEDVISYLKILHSIYQAHQFPDEVILNSCEDGHNAAFNAVR